jgi:hypothetical protein
VLFKFFKHGKKVDSAISYLLGDSKSPRKHSRLLEGDIEELKNACAIAETLFKRSYTSGVLSFSCDDTKKITEQQKREIIASFEGVLLPSLVKNDDYKIIWVEHTDKQRLELNFVVANIHVPSRKRLQVYYHKVDLKRLDTWKQLINYRYGLDEPSAKDKAQGTTKQRFISMTRSELVATVDNLIVDALLAEKIKTRDDIIKLIESHNLTVTRKTKKSISISVGEGKKPVRLKGAFYAEDFDAANYRDAKLTRSFEFVNTDALQAKLSAMIDKKAAYNAKRYAYEPADSEDSEQEQPQEVMRQQRDIKHQLQEPNLNVVLNTITTTLRVNEVSSDDRNSKPEIFDRELQTVVEGIRQARRRTALVNASQRKMRTFVGHVDRSVKAIGDVGQKTRRVSRTINSSRGVIEEIAALIHRIVESARAGAARLLGAAFTTLSVRERFRRRAFQNQNQQKVMGNEYRFDNERPGVEVRRGAQRLQNRYRYWP